MMGYEDGMFDEDPTPPDRTTTTPTKGVSDTFVRPCLTCGATVRVVASVEQPHDCLAFVDDIRLAIRELVARAWWNGHDAASERSS